MTDFNRIIKLEPGYDNRSSGGGIHGVTLRMALVGPLGAVHFVAFTGWTPEEKTFYNPHAAFLGYHSPEPMDHRVDSESPQCQYLGGHCFCSQSALNAEEPWRILREEGDDGVWRFLERYYRDVFVERIYAAHGGAH